MKHNLIPSFSVFHEDRNQKLEPAKKVGWISPVVGSMHRRGWQSACLARSLPLWPGSQSHSSNTFCNYVFLLSLKRLLLWLRNKILEDKASGQRNAFLQFFFFFFLIRRIFEKLNYSWVILEMKDF